MLAEPEPMLPTRGYRVLCHDATLIDLEAEGMWPLGTQLEFTVTTLVLGLPRPGAEAVARLAPRSGCAVTPLVLALPRRVVVQRCRRADVDLVLRDDGAVWPPLAVAGPAAVRAGPSGPRAPGARS